MADPQKPVPFRNLIERKMKELDIRSVEEFGTRFGIARGTMYTLYSGRISRHGAPVKPSIETLVALSKALKVSIYWLMYLLGPEALGQENFSDLEELLLDSGGNPERGKVLSELVLSSRHTPELLDLYPVGWTSDLTKGLTDDVVGYAWIEQDPIEHSSLQAFKAFGDSMEGGLHPVHVGDTLVINKSSRAEDGDLVVIQLEDRSRLCRLLRMSQYIATNPLKTDPTPVVVAPREAELLGQVVEIRHTFKAHD